jgi:hypothetical protein
MVRYPSTGKPDQEADMMTENTNEQPVCPQCGSEQTVPIVYGLPGDELLKEAEQGEVELGGCCMRGNDPNWVCRECGHRWLDED